MVQSAIKKGTILKCNLSTRKNINYTVVDFSDGVILASLDAIAEKGAERLDITDFWRVSGHYLRNNFDLVQL